MPTFIPTLPSDRKYVPLLLALAVVLTAIVLVFFVFNTAVKVDGDSMLPGLKNGDHLLMTRGYSHPRRGDIIAFSAVIDGKPDSLIKRIVAIEGDTIEVSGDSITVNGAPEAADYPLIRGSETIHLGPTVVPAGTVYVLGDNRPVSLDSRFIGPIKLSNVKGRAFYLFSPVTRLRPIDAAAGRP